MPSSMTASSPYDPDVIHSCHRCGRYYTVRPIENMNHWHFYNVYCSAWCAMPQDRRESWGYHAEDAEAVLLFLLDRAHRIYETLLTEERQWGCVINPTYWYGWEYSDTHPYQFASEFMDRTEQSLFLCKQERKDYANWLFEQANDQYNQHKEMSLGPQ